MHKPKNVPHYSFVLYERSNWVWEQSFGMHGVFESYMSLIFQHD